MNRIKWIFALSLLAVATYAAVKPSTHILGNGPEPVPECPVAVCVK